MQVSQFCHFQPLCYGVSLELIKFSDQTMIENQFSNFSYLQPKKKIPVFVLGQHLLSVLASLANSSKLQCFDHNRLSFVTTLQAFSGLQLSTRMVWCLEGPMQNAKREELHRYIIAFSQNCDFKKTFFSLCFKLIKNVASKASFDYFVSENYQTHLTHFWYSKARST